ncbi:olfactory receptor 6C4-like [Thalassophryne amazonica]|uniref:olfactory receptor 6C4-like n=1 Tax=Thalassophryne amazonica TaxID=390379 RepID=UPI001470F078|nr:olfactory receptor 6C4-like [Thalassophryne amazonica]
MTLSVELFNSALRRNITFVRPAYFIINGFSDIPHINYYYAFLFFVYIMSVLGNTAVMAVILLDQNLRTPKYVAVFNLAWTDLLGSTVQVPKVLDIFLFAHHIISYNDCMTFLFFSYTCLSMQSLNLVVLSYDRLVAITFPLHYHVKITHRFIFSLVGFFWVFVLTAVFIAVGLLTRLSICKSVIINSYFCDYSQIIQLACNDTTSAVVLGWLLPVLILWFPLIFILFSYSYIGCTLTKVASVQERVKAFKTCSAHLSLVAIYFLPILLSLTFIAHMHPNSRMINLSLTSVIPPMLNPFIYVLQTQEIKISMKKVLKIKYFSNIHHVAVIKIPQI